MQWVLMNTRFDLIGILDNDLCLEQSARPTDVKVEGPHFENRDPK